MKKSLIFLLLVLVLVSCKDVDNELNNKIEENSSIDESVVIEETISGKYMTKDDFVGTWTTVVKGDYFDDVYSLLIFEDGSFITNDFQRSKYKETMYGEWLSGIWNIENDKITFNIKGAFRTNYKDGIMDDTLLTETLDDQRALVFKLDKLNNESVKINENIYSKYVYVTNDKVDSSPNIGFAGEWERSNVHRAHSGYIDIISQDKNYIYFSAELYAGAHVGTLSGIARLNSSDEAVYVHTLKDAEDNTQIGYIIFKMVDGILEVDSNGYGIFGFGANVAIQGEYTQGTPFYTNADIIMETFDTEVRLNIMKEFLGENHWSFLERVMTYGYDFKKEVLTFSGFISGLGEGIDFLMTTDDMIYLLSYGEGPTNIFYTNDPMYRNLMPSFLVVKVRGFNNMQFVYKSEDEEIITDEYVWIRGHYEEPDSWDDSDVIKWDREEGSEYMEVICKGEVYNLRIVSLIYDGDKNQLRDGEIVYKFGDISNQIVVFNGYQPEGIPSEKIMFEDINGHTYHYIIEEKSLSGEADDLNEWIYRLE